MKTMRIGLLLVAWLVASSAPGAGLLGNDDSRFLPVDEAFQVSARADDGDAIAVTWRIADGYYLYRHAFDFAPADSDGPALGTPNIPDGHKKTDEFFGEVETYRHSVTVEIPLTNGTVAAHDDIRVEYQGCADAGLCYPPQTRVIAVDWGGAATDGNAPDSNPGGGFVAEQDRLAGLLDKANLIWILASFFGLGVLLAFTPCVLPMIPILSGIIVGRGGGVGAMRGFLLSSTYVLAMAAAYTVFGVIAGLSGTSLQAALQSPWVLVPFALLFVALALAMFGLYQLQLPAAWQTRLGQIGQRRSGGLLGAAAMGFAAALIVGPCLAPPLAGALLYIGSSGDALLGGAALFALGLGMGVPLIVLGTAGAGVLPKAGGWMDEVKTFFGVILLGVAIWLLARLLPAPLVLALWAVLLAGYGVHLGALEPSPHGGAQRLAKAAGLIGLVYAVILLVGAALGAGDPLRPLEPLTVAGSAAGSQSRADVFRRVQGLPGLREALREAARNKRPAVVDFYADWCVECVRMQRTVFNQPRVRQALAPIAALQVDVTDYDAADRRLLRTFDVAGPPTLLFFGADGEERRAYRLVGATDVAGFIARLRHALNS